MFSFSTETHYHAIALIECLRHDFQVFLNNESALPGQIANILVAFRFHLLEANDKELYVFWSVLASHGRFSYHWVRNPEF